MELADWLRLAEGAVLGLAIATVWRLAGKVAANTRALRTLWDLHEDQAKTAVTQRLVMTRLVRKLRQMGVPAEAIRGIAHPDDDDTDTPLR
jgi:hypothetical protein